MQEPALSPRSALEMLVSASCYLSLSPQGTSASMVEAAKLCHDLAAQLGQQASTGGLSQQDMEETVWLTKQGKWERHYCVQTAVRFVLSPRPQRTVAEVEGHVPHWARRLARWWGGPRRGRRGTRAVQPF